MAQNQFDIDCLRGIRTDADARRHALAAAMIKLHALSIARELPRFRAEALEIIGYTQQLYAAKLTRDAVAEVVREHVDRPGSGASAVVGLRQAERLTDALWTLFTEGRA